jgi:hypothetical protein
MSMKTVCQSVCPLTFTPNVIPSSQSLLVLITFYPSIIQSDRMESQVGRAEAQAAAAQEGLTRCRKELEETRKREVRLRDKLKEYLDTDGKGSGPGGRKVEEALLRVEQLEREVEVLRTQNLILRKSAATGGGDGDLYESDPGNRHRHCCSWSCFHHRSFYSI